MCVIYMIFTDITDSSKHINGYQLKIEICNILCIPIKYYFFLQYMYSLFDIFVSIVMLCVAFLLVYIFVIVFIHYILYLIMKSRYGRILVCLVIVGYIIIQIWFGMVYGFAMLHMLADTSMTANRIVTSIQT